MEEKLDKEFEKKPKQFTLLWVALVLLFLASGVVIFGIWSSYKNETVNGNLALVTSDNSGEVLGTTTEDPDYILKLVDDLKVAGIIFYGFNGNQESTKQLAIFGQATASLDYVECNSQSVGANADECVARGVSQYPTWIKGDQKFVGYQTLQDLEKILSN